MTTKIKGLGFMMLAVWMVGCQPAGLDDDSLVNPEFSEEDEDKYDWSKPLPAPKFEISIPDNLGRPPTSADITIVRGPDGRTPDTVIDMVRSRSKGEIAPSNEDFLANTVRAVHKSWTLAAWNILGDGTPPNQFVKSLGDGANVTVLGTLSVLTPHMLQVVRSGQPTVYYKKNASGKYEEASLTYQIVMRCRIQLAPMGVATIYPKWSAPQLAGPTNTTTN